MLEVQKYEQNDALETLVKQCQPTVSMPKVKRIRNRTYTTSTELYERTKTMKIKHLKKVRSNEVELINDDPVLSLNWHFYKKELIMANKAELVNKFRLHDAIYDIETLKEISDYVFYNATDDYYYIVGIASMYGWKPDDDKQKVHDYLINWTQNDWKPTFLDSTEQYNDEFRMELRKFFREGKIKKNIKVESQEEFCTNIVETSSTGSAYDPGGPRVRVEVGFDEVKVMNTKFAKSAALSVKEKMKRLNKMKPFKHRASVKVELFPKQRIIVSAEYDATLKMRYVNKWFNEWMREREFCTLYQNKSQTLDMWLNIADNTKGFNCPTDQNKFDHHVTAEMVKIYLQEKTDLIRQYSGSDDLVHVSKTIEYGITNGTIEYDGTTYKWLSGILSGWQITAEIDSIVNLIQNRLAVKQLKRMTIDVDQKHLYVQGDDVACKFKTVTEAMCFISSMRMSTYVIHPSKSFISVRHNEFLRKYYFKGEINGYPSRMVNGLLWLYPGDQTPKMVKEKLSSTVDKWTKFYERMRTSNKQHKLSVITSDLLGAKVPQDLIKKYLSTQRVMGGAELISGANYEINEIPGRWRRRVSVNSPGYEDFRLRFGKYQVREMEDWIVKVLNVPGEYKGNKLRDDAGLEVKPERKIEPLRYTIVRGFETPQTERNSKLPNNVLFGKSKEFMGYVFPNIESFVQKGRAPKSWIYDFLLGRTKLLTPKIAGMSDEFASYFYEPYKASLINAMYHKKNVPDKWLRLNQYANEYFAEYLVNNLNTKVPRMY